MKKSRKILASLLSIIIILVLIVLIGINVFADGAVKKGIELGGTKVLNVNVALGSADLSLLRGSLGLQKLAIDNPPGYQHKQLLEMSKGDVTVNVKSLLSDTVNIKSIKLDGLDIVLEQKDLLRNNLKDILKSLPKSDDKTAEPSGKKLHIDVLEITNARAKVKLLPVPGKVDTVTVKLAPIKMTDIGGDNKVDTGALVGKILVAITKGIAQQGADVLPTELLDSLGSELQKLGAIPAALIGQGGKVLEAGLEAGKDVLEKGTDVTGGVLKGVGDAGKGVTDGLKGILGGKKKD